MKNYIDDFIAYFYMYNIDRALMFIPKYTNSKDKTKHVNFIKIAFREYQIDLLKSNLRNNQIIYNRGIAYYTKLMERYGEYAGPGSTESIEILVKE